VGSQLIWSLTVLTVWCSHFAFHRLLNSVAMKKYKNRITQSSQTQTNAKQKQIPVAIMHKKSKTLHWYRKNSAN
jgi:hypothetical protein